MKVLVTGAAGQVGAETAQCAWPSNWQITRVDRKALDITDAAALEEIAARLDPDVIINCAAYTAVDRAESEPGLAHAVNRDGPAALAALCARRRAALIHLSTDYVFDGAKPAPYVETDAVAPLGVYGASKEAGETAIRRSLDRHLILRTAWVYGVHGNNFVKTMLRLGATRDTIRVVSDQRGCPTLAADIAGALVHLTRRIAEGAESWGTYHYAGAGETSWAGFAEAIFANAEIGPRRRPEIVPIATADYPTATRRPANSRLDCGKIARDFGIVPRPWQEAIGATLAAMPQDQGS